MKKIYICSPYRDNPEYNTKVALRAAEAVTMINCMPIVPHIYFTQFLDENNQDQRNFGINCGIELLKSLPDDQKQQLIDTFKESCFQFITNIYYEKE